MAHRRAPLAPEPASPWIVLRDDRRAHDRGDGLVHCPLQLLWAQPLPAPHITTVDAHVRDRVVWSRELRGWNDAHAEHGLRPSWTSHHCGCLGWNTPCRQWLRASGSPQSRHGGRSRGKRQERWTEGGRRWEAVHINPKRCIWREKLLSGSPDLRLSPASLSCVSPPVPAQAFSLCPGLCRVEWRILVDPPDRTRPSQSHRRAPLTPVGFPA